MTKQIFQFIVFESPVPSTIRRSLYRYPASTPAKRSLLRPLFAFRSQSFPRATDRSVWQELTPVAQLHARLRFADDRRRRRRAARAAPLRARRPERVPRRRPPRSIRSCQLLGHGAILARPASARRPFTDTSLNSPIVSPGCTPRGRAARLIAHHHDRTVADIHHAGHRSAAAATAWAAPAASADPGSPANCGPSKTASSARYPDTTTRLRLAEAPPAAPREPAAAATFHRSAALSRA